jgi:type I restriction enzyme S subunit
MILVPITEVCDFQGGTQPPKSEWSDKAQDGYVRMLQIRDFTQRERNAPEYVKEASKLNKCTADDVLIGRYGASVGKILRGLSGAYNVAIVKSIPDESKVTKDFLYYLFKSPVFQNFILNVGDRAAQAGFNKTDLKKFQIPLLPLNDQKRISHLLGKVEVLINERKQNIQQLDDLLKSVFLDMFGDPVRNMKGWDTDSLYSYGKFKNGLNYGKGESGFKVRYLGVGDFKSHSKIDNINSLSYIELSTLPAEDYFLKDGDILFVRSNGNKELIGRCIVIYPQAERVTYSGFCIRFRSESNNLNPVYLAHLFREVSFHKELLKGGQGANIQNINQKLLGSLDIPIPPPEIQSLFVSIVEKVEIIKSQYQQSLSDLVALYGSLSQKAFKGDLDLSNIPLPLDATAEPINQFTDEPVAEPFPLAKPLIMPWQTNSEYPLSDPKSRRQVLEYAFATFLNNIQTGDEISLAEFWQTLLWQAGDYADETDLPFNVNDYDLVKKQLFQAIADGKVEQQINKIQLQNEVTDGNQILLKKLG